MRRLCILVILPLMGATATDFQEIDGSKLPNVPGPFTSRMADPARDMNFNDIGARIRTQARHAGSITPAVALPQGSLKVKDKVADVSGWKAYRVEVPVGGAVHMRLRGHHEGWFVVRTMNKWGSLEKGMLQNVIKTGNPEARYANPTKEAKTIYFVVDTTELNTVGEEYTLEVTVS
ncbi:MAG: hypothetical protein IPP78_10590 [Holophagaceae bacterium]|nr:hypothetical protein [Holophagaceae bacterium]